LRNADKYWYQRKIKKENNDTCDYKNFHGPIC
jgi:hypothetical protein